MLCIYYNKIFTVVNTPCLNYFDFSYVLINSGIQGFSRLVSRGILIFRGYCLVILSSQLSDYVE